MLQLHREEPEKLRPFTLRTLLVRRNLVGAGVFDLVSAAIQLSVNWTFNEYQRRWPGSVESISGKHSEPGVGRFWIAIWFVILDSEPLNFRSERV